MNKKMNKRMSKRMSKHKKMSKNRVISYDSCKFKVKIDGKKVSHEVKIKDVRKLDKGRTEKGMSI
jgi:hypothetical protein